jgi:hypothetical protein
MTDSEDRASDSRHLPDSTIDSAPLDDADLTISAVFDREASAEDVRRVTEQPGLQARLELFERVANRVSGPVPDLPQADVDRIIDMALAAFDETEPEASATIPAMATSLAGRPRGRPNQRRRWEWAAGAAAAAVLLLGLVAALTSSSRHTNTSSTSALADRSNVATSGQVDPGVTSGVAAAAGSSSTAPASQSAPPVPPSPMSPKAAVSPETAAATTATPAQQGLQPLGTFATEDALLASMGKLMSVPPGASNQDPNATSPPAVTSASPGARDAGTSGGSARADGSSCALPSGVRALGTAVVAGTPMLVARDDASGHILGYNAANCARVFDRSP